VPGDVVGVRPGSNEVTRNIRELGAQTFAKSRQSATGLMPYGRFQSRCERRWMDTLAIICRQLEMAYGIAHGPLEISELFWCTARFKDEDEYCL